MNICVYLKFRKPMCRNRFIKTISQEPDYIKTLCNDRNNRFELADRSWFFFNQSN